MVSLDLTSTQWALVALAVGVFVTFWMAVAALARPIVVKQSGSGILDKFPGILDVHMPIKANIESSAEARDLDTGPSLSAIEHDNPKKAPRLVQHLPYTAGFGWLHEDADAKVDDAADIFAGAETPKRIPKLVQHLPYLAGTHNGWD